MSETSNDLRPTPGERFRATMSTPDARGSLALGIVATLATAAAGLWWFPSTMPEVMSDEVEAGIETIVNLTVIASPVVGVVLGITAYAFLNRHKGSEPPQEDGPAIRTNAPAVLTWTVVSSLFCTLAVVWGLAELGGGETKALAYGKDAVVIEVTGSQWVWTYRYPEAGVESHELVMPVNTPVLFKVTSADVTHSFWPVQLGVKINANKGVTTTAFTIPTEVGGIDIHCAELCGLYHAYMANEGRIVMPNEYQQWLDEQKAASA